MIELAQWMARCGRPNSSKLISTAESFKYSGSCYELSGQFPPEVGEEWSSRFDHHVSV